MKERHELEHSSTVIVGMAESRRKGHRRKRKMEAT